MVDTPVLEAGAERRESSSLSWGTKSKSLFLSKEASFFLLEVSLLLLDRHTFQRQMSSMSF